MTERAGPGKLTNESCVWAARDILQHELKKMEAANPRDEATINDLKCTLKTMIRVMWDRRGSLDYEFPKVALRAASPSRGR